MSQESQKIALIGASRGLGAAVAKLLSRDNQSGSIFEVLVSARKFPEFDAPSFFSCDLSNEENLEELLEKLDEFQPHRIFYFAGGGPFGNFEDKAWKDHNWAWQVSFHSPAKILHESLKKRWKSLEQFLTIGSLVAEAQPDPYASSYASAKHAMIGLVTSIWQEERQIPLDIRLFSPGYMDTDLLPKNAFPRREGKALAHPDQVAEVLWDWALKGDPNSHFRYENPLS